MPKGAEIFSSSLGSQIVLKPGKELHFPKKPVFFNVFFLVLSSMTTAFLTTGGKLQLYLKTSFLLGVK